MTWTSPAFEITYFLLWITVLLLAVTVLYLGRQIGVLYQQIGPAGAMMANPGPELGASIQQATFEDIDGRSIMIGGIQERRTLIVFVSPGCTSCAEVASAIKAIAYHERKSLDVVLISGGTDNTMHQDFRARHALRTLPYIISGEFRQKMNISTFPYALLLDQNGSVRSKGIVNSLNHLESVLNVIDTGITSIQERLATSDASVMDNS